LELALDYSKKIIDQQHEKTILDNGLTVLSMNKKDVDSISIEIWVKVGSRYENSSISGLSHFIEHMNFKGTSTRSAQDIAEEIDAIGGYLNAYTSKENTVYSVKVLKEYLPLSIEILSDIIFNSVYEEEEIEREKNVVLQELAQTEDSPEEIVMENFSEILFSNQALGRSILGTKDNRLC
jgi:predicted Zn-dependent peptidase